MVKLPEREQDESEREETWDYWTRKDDLLAQPKGHLWLLFVIENNLAG
jgi:hypothetical protein